MATWLENQRDKARRDKLARELTHAGNFDNEAIRAQRWNELASAPGQLAQGAFTGLVGAPVDIANMALRPIGLGSDRPVGGSASLASMIRADEKSLPYQAGTMLPISPEGLAIGGAKLAGLIGATKGASKAQDIWKAVDTLQHPAGTIYSPRNKYIANPNYNTGLDVGRQGGLPTRDQYDRIAWEQKIKTKQDQEIFQQEMQAAIDADARRAAERGNVQPASDLQNQLSDDEWFKQFVQGKPARSARQDEAQYLTPEQRLHQYAAPKTEFELAHEVAQRNAALPVEQGGLGLPLNNTAMDRAKAMGFDTPVYHGGASNISEILPEKFGSATGAQSAKQAFWAAQDPSTARGYAEYAATDAPVKQLMDKADLYERIAQKGNNAYWDKYDDALMQAEDLQSAISADPLRGQNIMPLMVNSRNVNQMDAGGAEFVDLEGGVNKFLNQTKRGGNDVGIIQNLADDVGFNARPTTHYAIINPSSVRSRFAAFDPMQRNSANILAGGAAGAVGLSSLADLLNQQEYQ